jgi:hypothetical protein
MLFAVGAPIFLVGMGSMILGLRKSRSFEKPGQAEFGGRLSKIGGWLIFVGGLLLATFYFSGQGLP